MKIAFLDRDGVINEFPGNGNYVTKLKDFHFIPGSLEAIRTLTEHNFTIFVVSNQAGVGRGVYSKAKLDHITRRMLESVTKTGGKIKKVYYCIHTSQQGCDCRKPEIGSIKAAMALLKKPFSHARHGYFIGDTEGDITAGKKAGCKTIFVLSGMTNRTLLKQWKVRPDYIVKDLKAAVEIIVKNGSYS